MIASQEMEISNKKKITSGPFMGDPPFDNYGHINGFCCETKHVFLSYAQEDASRKIVICKWSDTPGGRNLNIAERDTSFKRKIEAKFEGNNKMSNKRKRKIKILRNNIVNVQSITIKFPTQRRRLIQLKEITKIISFLKKI